MNEKIRTEAMTAAEPVFSRTHQAGQGNPVDGIAKARYRLAGPQQGE